MSEAQRRQGGTLRYVATIAFAVVLLAAIVACLVVALTLIGEIPFHHIFPR
jgi:hypothetical protein